MNDEPIIVQNITAPRSLLTFIHYLKHEWSEIRVKG